MTIRSNNFSYFKVIYTKIMVYTRKSFSNRHERRHVQIHCLEHGILMWILKWNVQRRNDKKWERKHRAASELIYIGERINTENKIKMGCERKQVGLALAMSIAFVSNFDGKLGSRKACNFLQSTLTNCCLKCFHVCSQFPPILFLFHYIVPKSPPFPSNLCSFFDTENLSLWYLYYFLVRWCDRK